MNMQLSGVEHLLMQGWLHLGPTGGQSAGEVWDWGS
jgi:hypothetical protein